MDLVDQELVAMSQWIESLEVWDLRSAAADGSLKWLCVSINRIEQDCKRVEIVLVGLGPPSLGFSARSRSRLAQKVLIERGGIWFQFMASVQLLNTLLLRLNHFELLFYLSRLPYQLPSRLALFGLLCGACSCNCEWALSLV